VRKVLTRSSVCTFELMETLSSDRMPEQHGDLLMC
jgi:hypothetical protein